MDSETRWELSWKRPENIRYPKVWHRFEAISKKTASKYKIRIQDIPPDRFEEAVHFNEQYMDRCEPVFSALRIWEDPESVIALRIVRRKLLEQRISLMAVIDEEDDVHSKPEMMGMLLIGVKSKNDPPTKQAGMQANKMFDLFAFVMKGYDPFKLLESDRYIFHFGVTVAPKYYGLGVGLELELRSAVIGKACGLKGSCIMFTTPYSQPFGEKIGSTFMNEIRYDEFKNENGELIIPNIVGSSKATYVIWKYQ